MAHKEYITKISTDTAELKELLEVIASHANPVPSILYTLASEKADAIALAVARMRALSIEEKTNVASREERQTTDSPAGEDDELAFTIEYQENILTVLPKYEEKKEVTVTPDEIELTVTDVTFEKILAKENSTAIQQPVPLEELLQRRLVTHDIRKAISINDRFRFSRELFSNNDVLMNSTIDVISEMHNFDDVTEYIADTFDWDIEKNPTAEDFINIIKRRFL